MLGEEIESAQVFSVQLDPVEYVHPTPEELETAEH